MQVNLFSMKQRQTKNFTVQPFRIVYSRNSLMTTRPVRPHRTLCTCVAGKGKGISWKVRSNFVIQPASSLCATVSKRHAAGSSESISFDLLTARCLRSPAADLSSGPEPGIHSGFSNKMINNNSPPGERESGGDKRDRDKLVSGLCCVFCAVDSFSLLSFSPSPHLKFSLHFIQTWQSVWHDLQTSSTPLRKTTSLAGTCPPQVSSASVSTLKYVIISGVYPMHYRDIFLSRGNRWFNVFENKIVWDLATLMQNHRS